MARKVSEKEPRFVDEVDEAERGRLPDEVQLALADIASVAREGVLALSVTAGLAVLGEMMEAERTMLCGPAHAKEPGRVYTRGGTAMMNMPVPDGWRRLPVVVPRFRV